jgi:hypothetical protein
VLRWVVDVLEEKIYGKEVCGKLYWIVRTAMCIIELLVYSRTAKYIIKLLEYGRTAKIDRSDIESYIVLQMLAGYVKISMRGL